MVVASSSIRIRKEQDMAKPYEGYPSWNSWNVSLWINNDYNDYMIASSTIKEHGMRKGIDTLTEMWKGLRTPDGGVFNKRSISLAVEGMDE